MLLKIYSVPESVLEPGESKIHKTLPLMNSFYVFLFLVNSIDATQSLKPEPRQSEVRFSRTWDADSCESDLLREYSQPKSEGSWQGEGKKAKQGWGLS